MYFIINIVLEVDSLNISNSTSQEPENRKFAMAALCSKLMRVNLNSRDLSEYDEAFEKVGDFGIRIKQIAADLGKTYIKKSISEAEKLVANFTMEEYFKKFKELNNLIVGKYFLSPVSLFLDYFYSPSGIILSDKVVDTSVKAISSMEKTQYDITDCLIVNQFLNTKEIKDKADQFVCDYAKSKGIDTENVSISDNAYLVIFSQLALKNSIANKYADESVDFYGVSIPSIAGQIFTEYKVLKYTKLSLESFIDMISKYTNEIIENLPEGNLETREEIEYDGISIDDITAVRSGDNVSLDYNIEGRRRVVTIDLKNLKCSGAYMLFSDILVFITILNLHNVYKTLMFRQQRDLYKIVGVNASGLDYDRREEIQNLFE